MKLEHEVHKTCIIYSVEDIKLECTDKINTMMLNNFVILHHPVSIKLDQGFYKVVIYASYLAPIHI